MVRRDVLGSLNADNVRPPVIRKHCIGYTRRQALITPMHIPHGASANRTDTVTTRLVVFACHVIEPDQESHASRKEKEFHSWKGCIERMRQASQETTPVADDVADNLAGCDALIYEEAA